MYFRRIVSALAVSAVAALLGIVGFAGPANAAERNGVVEPGEFGLYYYTNYGGPVFDLFYSDSNFAGDVFPGTGISADNNTESYRNRDSYWWHVFTGASYTGSHGCLPAGYAGNASATFKNTISSAYWSSAGC